MHPALQVVTGADLPPLGFSSEEPFDPSRFTTPTNQPIAINGKPDGGLWLSPLTTGPGETPHSVYADAARGMFEAHLSTWEVRLRPDASVLCIDTRDDFAAALNAYPPLAPGDPGDPDDPAGMAEFLGALDRMGGRGFDFERIAADFDALWLTARGAQATRHTRPGLSCWDVESVLVLRAAAIR